jgi:hypothetical protein
LRRRGRSCSTGHLRKHAVQAIQLCDRDGDPTEFLFHLAPKYERSLIEQDVTALAKHLREEHGLNQAGAIVEGGELHGLVLDSVHRLGGREHAGDEYLLSDVAVQLGTGTQTKSAERFGVKGHGVGIGDEPQGGELFPPPALRGVVLEDWDGGRKVVEPVRR